MPSVELLASLLARRLRRTENTSLPASVKCSESGHTRGGKQFSAAALIVQAPVRAISGRVHPTDWNRLPRPPDSPLERRVQLNQLVTGYQQRPAVPRERQPDWKGADLT